VHNRNLFVIFAPGGGGNHLANMLSLSEPFTSRITQDSYDNLDGNAHTPTIQNMKLSCVRDNIDILKNQSNVFCGHWLEYQQLRNSELIDYFPNREFFVITVPNPASTNTRALRRLLNYDKTLSVSWILYELSLLYRVEHLRFLCNEPTAIWRWVWPDHLFDDSITALVENLKSQGLDLNLDIDQLQPLHTKWLQSIDRQINE
jgi:hypothetical protein